MASRKRGRPEAVGVVILAAGYGTRLARDMRADPAFDTLRDTPKPLLPLRGRTLLDRWIDDVPPGTKHVVIVVNGAHREQYERWLQPKFLRPPAQIPGGVSENGLEVPARLAGSLSVAIISDGSTSNDTRTGAVSAMAMGLKELETASGADVHFDLAVVIAGDTLLPGVDMGASIEAFDPTAEVGVFTYHLADPADCVRRGMLKLGAHGDIEALVEKPASAAESPSDLATAPVYVLRRGAWKSVPEFLARARAAAAGAPGGGLDARDAPGYWLADVVPRRRCVPICVEERVDIGGLAHYKDALARFGAQEPRHRADVEPAVGRALPRVGLLGNPSDGYGGKCLAFSLQSEGYAEVVASPAERFEIGFNPAHEIGGGRGSSLDGFAAEVAAEGVHHGARQLVIAAAALFSQTISRPGSRIDTSDSCALRYSTTIPMCLGLSGSSAFVLATMRALALFYKVNLADIDGDIRSWPARVLRAETDFLGYTAGLMDRVAQVYGGCTFMNFSQKGLPVVEQLGVANLPRMWIAYASHDRAGEGSSVVHSKLRERYDAGEEEIVAGMEGLAVLAEEGRTLLCDSRDAVAKGLPSLVAKNWSLRVKLMGAEAMDPATVRMRDVAHLCGFAAKQTGSGGAILCVPEDAAFDAASIPNLTEKFESAGFLLKPVVPGKVVAWEKSCY